MGFTHHPSFLSSIEPGSDLCFLSFQHPSTTHQHTIHCLTTTHLVVHRPHQVRLGHAEGYLVHLGGLLVLGFLLQQPLEASARVMSMTFPSMACCMPASCWRSMMWCSPSPHLHLNFSVKARGGRCRRPPRRRWRTQPGNDVVY